MKIYKIVVKTSLLKNLYQKMTWHSIALDAAVDVENQTKINFAEAQILATNLCQLQSMGFEIRDKQ